MWTDQFFAQNISHKRDVIHSKAFFFLSNAKCEYIAINDDGFNSVDSRETNMNRKCDQIQRFVKGENHECWSQSVYFFLPTICMILCELINFSRILLTFSLSLLPTVFFISK